MKIIRRHLVAWPLAMLTALALSLSAQAAPPKDTFVMAKDISDIITMDPAEVFELSGDKTTMGIVAAMTNKQ